MPLLKRSCVLVLLLVAFRIQGLPVPPVTAPDALGAVTAPVLMASADGTSFVPVIKVDAAERVHVAPPKGDSKIRQTQVDYKVTLPGGTRHLKIVWSRQMALDRVEIECGP